MHFFLSKTHWITELEGTTIAEHTRDDVHRNATAVNSPTPKRIKWAIQLFLDHLQAEIHEKKKIKSMCMLSIVWHLRCCWL